TAAPGRAPGAADDFRRTYGDIRRVVAVIVSAPEFYARSAVRAKVKSPYQLVASTYRVMGGIPDSGARSVNLSQGLGQQLWGRQTPDGWPDNGQSWLNTGALLGRINFGTNVAAGRIPGIPKRDSVGLSLASPEFQRR
ncbi:MAG: DUF1800 family protein, partial [Gemmatimonas sp.]